MHDEKLCVFFSGGLRLGDELPALKSGDGLGDSFDSLGNHSVAKVGEGAAGVGTREIAAKEDRSRVDAVIHEMNCDAKRNVAQNRPLGAAHTPNLGE